MKYFYVIYLIFCVVSCKAKNTLNLEKTSGKTVMMCPEDGACNFETLTYKRLQIKTDNLGRIYPEIMQGNSVVLKFEYIKNGNTNFQDSSYREELFLELDKNNMEIETENLENQKFFFARWCYCKGQTGYYKINTGKLRVTEISDNEYRIDFSFIMDEVPHIIKAINYNFSLQ